MEFPPKVLYPRRFQATQFPADEVAAVAETTAVFRDKLTVLACRHEQVKIAYHQLHSQIKIGLVEAGEVFASLAIPLMKLVGLKTSELATEGRFSAVFLNERDQIDAIRSASESTQNGIRVTDMKNQIQSSKVVDEYYAAKVETAGKEILDKQQIQLIQLVQILRHVESHINSHHENILQIIDHHKTFFHEFIRKAIYYINTVCCQSHDTFPVTVVKLLRVIFNNFSEVLGSVDCGVKDLMQALADQMCCPMSKYVNDLTAEIKRGPCVQLMSVVNEMKRVRADIRQELEDARARIKDSEEKKNEILSRLKEAEEQVRRMKVSLNVLPTRPKRPAIRTVALKRLGTAGNQENDEKLLWEILRKKRKLQVPESSTVTKELSRQTNNMRKPSFYHQSTTMLVSPQTPHYDHWIPLGLSPSVKASTLR